MEVRERKMAYRLQVVYRLAHVTMVTQSVHYTLHMLSRHKTTSIKLFHQFHVKFLLNSQFLLDPRTKDNSQNQVITDKLQWKMAQID